MKNMKEAVHGQLNNHAGTISPFHAADMAAVAEEITLATRAYLETSAPCSYGQLFIEQLQRDWKDKLAHVETEDLERSYELSQREQRKIGKSLALLWLEASCDEKPNLQEAYRVLQRLYGAWYYSHNRLTCEAIVDETRSLSKFRKGLFKALKSLKKAKEEKKVEEYVVTLTYLPLD